MRTIKLVIAYDGTGYFGWQRQKDDTTIQAEIETAVSVICNSKVSVHGAGRTDAGVHALGMSAHFQTLSTVSCDNLVRGLNSLLPSQIRVIEASERPADFHARFSATGKTYRYSISTSTIQSPMQRLYVSHCPVRLSAEVMRSCLKIIVGTHDFSSFETSGTRDKTMSTGKGATRTIFDARLEVEEPDLYHLIISGDGFLRHMVRNLTGTIIEVGQAKCSVDDFQLILAARDRQQAGTAAPAHGLTLISVDYAY